MLVDLRRVKAQVGGVQQENDRETKHPQIHAMVRSEAQRFRYLELEDRTQMPELGTDSPLDGHPKAFRQRCGPETESCLDDMAGEKCTPAG